MAPAPALIRLLVQLARPVRLAERRLPFVERLVRTPLTATDEVAVRRACAQGGARLGEFYHWYLQKLLVSTLIRGLDRKRALALISSVDHTDYAGLASITGRANGTLLAVPHHGHYIFSIIHLAERLRAFRRVLVFYGQPSTHQGNEIFDVLHGVIFRDGDNVEVVHDTRQGMAKAMRALRNGDVVVIMPDVFRNEEHTEIIPFCGRQMNVMLGTAMLARRTGATIVPVVARQHGKGLGFETWFGTGIVHEAGPDHEAPGGSVPIMDYRVTRELFDQYETVMRPELLYWQFVRQHMGRASEHVELGKDELRALLALLPRDPQIAAPVLTLDLRTSTA
ncbi:MAG TPA: hypothetical protein VLK29_05625 [Luteimonas sp.]|nr:hypothetical protein [Luteimonas sp.]